MGVMTSGLTVGPHPGCAALRAEAAVTSPEEAAWPSWRRPPEVGAATRGVCIRICSAPEVSEAVAQEATRPGPCQEDPTVPEAALPDWLAARA